MTIEAKKTIHCQNQQALTKGTKKTTEVMTCHPARDTAPVNTVQKKGINATQCPPEDSSSVVLPALISSPTLSVEQQSSQKYEKCIILRSSEIYCSAKLQNPT